MARKVKDTELYDILGVAPVATDIELKKAYRKKAIQWHPDKNTAPEAEAKFKEIGEAYQVLSNNDSRAFYDKVGRAGMGKGEGDQIDPQEIFSKIFGGEAFYDYIGEISLVKDFTSTMDVVMTPEERAEMEAASMTEGNGKAAEGTSGSTSEPAAATPSGSTYNAPDHGAGPSVNSASIPGHHNALAHHVSMSSSPSGSGSDVSKPNSSAKDKKGKPKLSPEQKAQLQVIEKRQEAERKARIEALRAKLIQRIRPFVEAKKPGEANDPETTAFEQRIRTEADDLKLESFGVELLHTLGNVYITKAGNFLKSRKFFGGGFIGRLKEKGGMVKEGWNLLGSAIGVQSAMEEMERLEAKGDATPEEMDALAQEVSSKMLLTTWRATRWEVISVVGPVVDDVLYEPGLSKEVSLRRAKAIMTIGGIFSNVRADESDEERRELERLVMNAGNKKKKAEKDKENDKDKETEKTHKGWGLGGHSHGKSEAEKPARTGETRA